LDGYKLPDHQSNLMIVLFKGDTVKKKKLALFAVLSLLGVVLAFAWQSKPKPQTPEQAALNEQIRKNIAERKKGYELNLLGGPTGYDASREKNGP